MMKSSQMSRKITKTLLKDLKKSGDISEEMSKRDHVENKLKIEKLINQRMIFVA